MECLMEFLPAAGAVAIVIGSFTAGWLTATEKIRTAVYVRKLDVYLKINALAADLLHQSIKTSVDAEKFAVPMFKSRLALAEYTASHSILVSKGLGPHIEKLTEATKQPDIEALRVTFNHMSDQMASELRLEKIHAVTTLLHDVALKK